MSPPAVRNPKPRPRRASGFGVAVGILLAWIGLHPAQGAASTDARADNVEFFEKRIRPVLADHCYSCHSRNAEKVKGGLLLDSSEGLLHGGELGPAIVPGDPDKSLLIRAVRYQDPDLQMPPKKGRLSDRQIADLTDWVRRGAPWPEEPSPSTRPATRPAGGISDADRAWWAFQPVRRSLPPNTPSTGPQTSPIDLWINAALHSRNLHPNPKATPRERIRRAYFDLIGLPPMPDAIEAFERDSSPDAWPRLVDHLLAQKQYGERWARHWLDVVRFAQSNGYERDGEKPLAWRYRDYVVDAFNADKPYGRFIREQIAGDELEDASRDSIVATGFLRLGVWDDEPDDKRMAEFDELDDVLSTTSSAFLGLTLGCARCHDHKFDPIPQADYYRMLACFRNLRLSEAARYTLDSPNYLPLASPETIDAWATVRETRRRQIEENLAVATDESERKELQQELAALKAERPPFEWALSARERGPVPPPTHILIRGNAGTPGPEVRPGFISVLGPPSVTAPSGTSLAPPHDVATTASRRRALAEWIASPSNPLTARVLVNRVWQRLFGRGIVATTSDFGRAGSPPTHPELLDWLASELIANGGSVKRLHRTIMLSEVYQRSSQADHPEAQLRDPANDYYWRHNLRRAEAEVLRDSILAISGSLNPKPGGRGFFPRLSGEVLAGQSRPGLDWDISPADELSRRSLYAYVRRTMLVPMLDTFDYSNTTSPLSERPVTTVAPQALLLLNDRFMHDQARVFATRLLAEAVPKGDRNAMVELGFRLATGRSPSQPELDTALSFLLRQKSRFQDLRQRLTFRPDVPLSLSVDYMNKLRPDQFLVGPAQGWEFHRGQWSAPYEGIRTQERDRGPFALLKASGIHTNVTLRARLVPHTAFESGGLLFRARAKDDTALGYELSLEPREQRLQLRRLGTNSVVLGESPVLVGTETGVEIEVRTADRRIEVLVGSPPQPAIRVEDPDPITDPGFVGIRAWGAALSLENLQVESDGASVRIVRDESLDPPEHRALQSFCLMLFNLNEVVYTD